MSYVDTILRLFDENKEVKLDPEQYKNSFIVSIIENKPFEVILEIPGGSVKFKTLSVKEYERIKNTEDLFFANISSINIKNMKYESTGDFEQDKKTFSTLENSPLLPILVFNWYKFHKLCKELIVEAQKSDFFQKTS